MTNNIKKEKIAAVVVTFNRKELLKECLAGVLNQVYPIDKVFIVDNNSTDGTPEFLKKEGFLNNELIKYLRLSENTGSAGGFHEGVKMAYEEGADWVWFLDDDVSPRPDCLKIMLYYKHISKCMHPSKFDVNGQEFFWESIFDVAMGRVTFIPNTSFKNGKDFTFVNVGCFEGMFIHRDIVSKIGFPDKRFFIGGDDTIYGFLASLYTNVIFIKEAVINKLIPFGTVMKPIPLYYAIRNQFLIKEYLKKYNLLNKQLFYIYLFIYIVYATVKQTIINKSIVTPFYIFKGVIHGFMGRFYKL